MSDGISDARRHRSLDDIAATGARWITDRELSDLIEELRDLQSRVRCHCVRAAGSDGKITSLCAWHDQAAARLYGDAAVELSNLRAEHHSLKNDVARLTKDAAEKLNRLAELSKDEQ